MGRWCPRCGAEYIEGWGTCSDCGVELVEERPAPPAEPEVDYTPDDAIFVEPKRARNHEDPFVAIWEGPTPEGSLMANRLEAEHIPVDLGEAAEPGQLRIEVPRSYINEAYGVLDASDPYALDPDVFADSNDDDPWTEDISWPPWVRTVLIVVALALVLALIFTSR